MYLCQGLLLDMDGTLIDSDRAHTPLWERWAAHTGAPLDRILALHHGRRPEETVSLVAPHLDVDEEVERISKWGHEVDHEIEAYPGVAELLKKLDRDRYAVVTSAATAPAVRRLTALGLWHDPHFVSADHVTRGKPHPEPFERGAEKLGLRPDQCVAVEDSPAGVASARASGAKVLAVLTTHRRSELEADWYVEHLGRLEVEATEAGLRLEL